MRPWKIVVPAIICGALLLPGSARAQEPRPVEQARAHRPLFEASLARGIEQQSAPRAYHAVKTGALIGAAGALAITAAAAAEYGNNEGGRFCGPCLVQWSAFTVPVGAAIGAAIGYGIDRAHRSVTAVPVFSRKQAGVVVSARF